MMKRIGLFVGLVIGVTALGWAPAAFGLPYSSGSYGTCSYNACSITLSSSGSVAVNVTPNASALCSVQSDSVSASTGASTGYVISMTDNDTNNSLVSGANSVTAVSGTAASPAALTANKWGYRVDGIGSFGAGPTSSLSSGAIPSQTYAAVPLSSGTAATIRSTNSADGSTVNTSVWYGVCVNASTPSGTYTDSVVYTAVVNS
jgi:hypothetical protein